MPPDVINLTPQLCRAAPPETPQCDIRGQQDHTGPERSGNSGNTIMEPTAGKLFGKIGDAMRLAAGMAALQPAMATLICTGPVCFPARRPMTTATRRPA